LSVSSSCYSYQRPASGFQLKGLQRACWKLTAGGR